MSADWMSRSVTDDMREEARSGRALDEHLEHPDDCSCRSCQREESRLDFAVTRW